MNTVEKLKRLYYSSVKPMTPVGPFNIKFERRGLMHERGPNGVPGQPPRSFEAQIELTDKEMAVRWLHRPADSADLQELIAEARRLVAEHLRAQLQERGNHATTVAIEESVCGRLQFYGENDIEAVEFLKANEWGSLEADDPAASYRRVLLVFEELVFKEPQCPNEGTIVDGCRFYAQAAYGKDTRSIVAVVPIGRLRSAV